MTDNNSDIDPLAIVASALKCTPDSLSLESAMYRTHGWDSFGNLEILLALERAYGMSISNEESFQLVNMASIVAFHEKQVQAKRNGDSDGKGQ